MSEVGFDTMKKDNGNPEILKDGAWREMGLKDHEYRLIVEKLGREPNYTELGMFAVLWSEHCGYKHSRNLLKTLPTTGPQVLVGPGENAGVIDIGSGLAAAFKIESHNHPSAVEPYHGAATGAGGIVRDILAMGARPVALVGSMRFGPLSVERNRFLFSGVSAGMIDYCNSLGVPTVGADIFFAEPYTQNPLCNVMCLGLLSHSDLHRGQAAGVGNVVMIVGHSTGRDGIHGCTFASEEIVEGTDEKPPTVQGDPDMEKRLIEACLEMMAQGAVVGIQDMGAAGITSSSAETAARAGTGLAIETTKVPVREEGMTPYEIMLSESQERMLLIVTPDKVDIVKSIGARWGLNVAEIGVVTGSGNLEVMENGIKVAEVPARLLTEAPVYDPQWKEPEYVSRSRRFSADSIPVPGVNKFNEILLGLLALPNIASKEIVYKYSTIPGDFNEEESLISVDEINNADSAAVLTVKTTGKGLVLTAAANGRMVYLNPRAGTQWAVAEAARSIAVTGGAPAAISNCLNFGNPEKPEIFWQIKESVEGMAQACTALDTPVTGGNVSLYNETQGEPVYPTPAIGMIGLIDDAEKRITPGFKVPGHKIAILGKIYGDDKSLNGSEYLDRVHMAVAGDVRYPDFVLEKAIAGVLSEGAQKELFSSAQNVAIGGFGVAVAKCCIQGEAGARGASISLGSLHGFLEDSHRPDSVLFGESNSVVIVSFDKDNEHAITELCTAKDVPFTIVGEVTADRLVIQRCGACEGVEIVNLGTEEMAEQWRSGISREMEV